MGWLKKFGLVQNMLVPVKEQGIRFLKVEILRQMFRFYLQVMEIHCQKMMVVVLLYIMQLEKAILSIFNLSLNMQSAKILKLSMEELSFILLLGMVISWCAA